MRVQFAGTTALLANTNAAYLTNFAALPETAALGTQIVARVAGLPARLLSEDGGLKMEGGGGTNGNTGEHSTFNTQHSTSKEPTPALGAERETASAKAEHPTSNIQHPTSNGPTPSTNAAHGVSRPTGGELLRAAFAEMLRDGFTLELRGDSNGVTAMALAARAGGETAKRWEEAWHAAATNWFAPTTPTQEAPHPNPLPFRRGEGGWSAGEGRIMAKRFGDWFLIAMSKTDASAALAAIQKTIAGPGLEAGTVLQGELASSLLPGPIQRSVYGGFSRLKLSVAPADQSLKIRGTAVYAQDLPKLGAPPVVPTNLVTEPAISFTLVREPGAWLEPNSALRRFLPNPVPDVAFFWGGESSPYQLFMAIPFAGRDEFNTNFGPALRDQLLPLAKIMDTGSVKLDTNRATIQMETVPFVTPQVTVKQSGTTNYLVAEAFPPSDFPPGLTPALIEHVSGRTNLLLYDWEFTQLRFDTWFRIGQLALFSSGHQQHTGGTASLKWIQAVQLSMTGAINTSTEITQTGPRELSISRRAPLAFNSTELFWLANWLESSNFPAANFLMPVGQ